MQNMASMAVVSGIQEGNNGAAKRADSVPPLTHTRSGDTGHCSYEYLDAP